MTSRARAGRGAVPVDDAARAASLRVIVRVEQQHGPRPFVDPLVDVPGQRHRLDDAARERARQIGRLVAVQLHGLQVRFIRCGFYLVAPGVDEYAYSGHRRGQRVHNRPRPKRRDRARA
jgi:hypothetical protein